MRAGDYLYGSTGYDPFLVTAIHAATGKVAWQQGGFSPANLVAADGKLLLLDYDGVLALGTAGPEGFRVHSKASVLEAQAFTPPAVSGQTLYLRDQKRILAIDLGKPD
ncbi:MAG: hypothetical protein EXS08_13875 [Planctomycetes bacterium]|nr:hypothetical protein [Planctomycetota bacterium]